MIRRAKAIFKVVQWDQTAIDDAGAGPEWKRATVRKTFEGEVAGESRAELLLATTPVGGAGYVALERFNGWVGDREGTFDLQHGGAALANGETPHQFGCVVPNSGTGALLGLSGTVLFRHDAAGAVFTLDYTFEADAA